MKAISKQATLITYVNRVVVRRCAVGLAFCFAINAPSLAQAQSAADYARLSEGMKRLEARVAALESENKQAKKETAAARAEADVLRRKVEAERQPRARRPSAPIPTSTVAAIGATPGLYAMAVKAPPPAPTARWNGFYAGAAFGVGSMHANESFTDNSTLTFVVPALNETQITTNNETDTASGHNVAAMASLLIGYNFPLGSRFIGGVQVEGTLANTRVNLAGSGTDLSTTTFFFPPAPPAPPGISTSAFSFTDTLDNRWMVSALARAGALIDPNDLVYVIGGYTYGRFENIDGGFGLNGGTVGVGWERQIVPGWTLRGEYRYTRFQDTDLHVNTQSASSDGSSTTTFNTSQITHYSGLDMHSLWLGVSHYFWMN